MGKYCRQHIGKTFNDGKLTVVDGGDKNLYVKVRCNTCAEDSELFGEGTFKTSFYNLTKGVVPCGCSTRPSWSIDQYKVLINRKIENESLPIRFIRFESRTGKPSLTPIIMYCNKSKKEYVVSSVTNFLNGFGSNGRGNSISHRVKQHYVDNPNWSVWDTGKKSRTSVICGFKCKLCEARGRESLFEIRADHLLSGSIPCYCKQQGFTGYSGDYIVEMSKDKLFSQGLEGILVIGAYKKDTYWVSVFLCEVHGVYSRRYGNLESTGCQCLKCTPCAAGYNIMKKGYVYILNIKTSEGSVIGYGITGQLITRIGSHKRNLKSIGATITHIQVFEGSGTAVLAVENAIKSLHTTGLLDCEGFRRESIDIDRKDEVLEKCKKLKQLDNANKLI